MKELIRLKEQIERSYEESKRNYEKELKIIDDMIEKLEKKNEVELFISAKELSKILCVSGACIRDWMNKQIIKNFKQIRKNCSVLISYSEINRMFEENETLSKYQNNWINFLIQQKNK